MTKVCRKCKEEKPSSEFYLFPKNRDGLHSYCKMCSNELSRLNYHTPRGKKANLAWKLNNPEKVKASAARTRVRIKRTVRAGHYRRAYGITLELFDEILAKQGNKCAVCRSDNHGGKWWELDHNHATGNIRGILCRYCNITLGTCKEDIRRLQRCIAYLTFHTKQVHFDKPAFWLAIPQGGLPTPKSKKEIPQTEIA